MAKTEEPEYTPDERTAIRAFHYGVQKVAAELDRFATACELGSRPSTSAVGTKVLLLIADELALQGVRMPTYLYTLLREESERIYATAVAMVEADKAAQAATGKAAS